MLKWGMKHNNQHINGLYLYKPNLKNMKKNAFLLVLVLIACLGCHRATDAPAPEQPSGPTTKAPTSKVLLTYTGEIKDGDWIEIDELARMEHVLDTSDIIPQQDEFGQFNTRQNYPTFSPSLSLDGLWISRPYFKSWMTGAWAPANRVLGYPPISLVFYLDRKLKKGNPYGTLTESRPYKLSFEEVPATEWAIVDATPSTIAGGGISADVELKRFTRLRLERTDGQPIRIRTSEGYAAKIEYQ
jgi:hypothetical protein